MLESFGGRLRQRREEQEIALTTIAEQTKIKLSLLEALERDDVSHWPSGIFRRAFIRAYAHAIGLNPDVVVRQFLEIYPDPIEEVLTADDAQMGGGPATRLRYLVGSAIGTLSRLRSSPIVLDDLASRDPAQVDAPAPLEPNPTPVSHPSAEAGRVEVTRDVVADCLPTTVPALPEPDMMDVARLCTEFGRVEKTDDVQTLLQEAARILDAVGVIVWVWDAAAAELRPALAHGYSDKVLAQLPAVGRDTDNATAAAFRSGQICAIDGGHHANGALVAPMLTPGGCAGVLAVELPHGSEQRRSVRAVVAIVAAQLSQLMGAARSADVRPGSARCAS